MTAPYGWNGAGGDVEEHLTHTFQRLRGGGLPKPEADALLAYIGSMQPPTTRAQDRAKVARGKDVFSSRDTGCATCHLGDGTFTDHAAHDVGSKAKADSAPSFDTPSLKFVGGTAPYFHDGRYPSLHALLVEADGQMGHTGQLSKDDMDALEAYLRSL